MKEYIPANFTQIMALFEPSESLLFSTFSGSSPIFDFILLNKELMKSIYTSVVRYLLTQLQLAHQSNEIIDAAHSIKSKLKV